MCVKFCVSVTVTCRCCKKNNLILASQWFLIRTAPQVFWGMGQIRNPRQAKMEWSWMTSKIVQIKQDWITKIVLWLFYSVILCNFILLINNSLSYNVCCAQTKTAFVFKVAEMFCNIRFISLFLAFVIYYPIKLCCSILKFQYCLYETIVFSIKGFFFLTFLKTNQASGLGTSFKKGNAIFIH